MVQLNRFLLAAVLAIPVVALALPKPVDEAHVSSRDAEPKTYSGVFLNSYEESQEKNRRDAEAEAEVKATYVGDYLNNYEESQKKWKRAAKGEAEDKATYVGDYLNNYEETKEKKKRDAEAKGEAEAED